MTHGETRAIRLWAVGAATLTSAVGLFGRSVPIAGTALGGIAYAVLIALIVAIVWPAVRPLVAAAVGLGVSIAVELLQLTAIPGVLTDAIPPLRWVLGSTFLWVDLLWYVVGAVVAWMLVVTIQRHVRA